MLEKITQVLTKELKNSEISNTEKIALVALVEMGIESYKSNEKFRENLIERFGTFVSDYIDQNIDQNIGK